MKRIYYLVSLIGLMLASCNSQDVIVVKDFSINEDLKGERIDLALSEYIGNMVQPAGDYYVFNAIRAGYCFQIYDKNFNFVDSIVGKGSGPDEIAGGAIYLGQWGGNNDSPKILAYGSSTKKLYEISTVKPYGIETVVDLQNEKGVNPSSLFKGEDSVYYGITLGIESAGGLFSFNAVDGELTKAPVAYEFNDALSPFYATQQCMAMDLKNNRICTAYLSYPCLAIYDMALNVIGRYNIGESIDTETLTKDSKCAELINVRYHNGNIAVLYCPTDTKERSIKVFSEKGKPIASYGVGDAIWYVIDEKHKCLLTVHYDKEKDVIYLVKYPMPKAFA